MPEVTEEIGAGDDARPGVAFEHASGNRLRGISLFLEGRVLPGIDVPPACGRWSATGFGSREAADLWSFGGTRDLVKCASTPRSLTGRGDRSGGTYATSSSA